MNIKTSISIVTSVAIAIAIIITVMISWLNYKISIASKADTLLDEIVITVFELTVLKSDYLQNNDSAAKELWIRKQAQMSSLVKQAPLHCFSDTDIQTIKLIHTII